MTSQILAGAIAAALHASLGQVSAFAAVTWRG